MPSSTSIPPQTIPLTSYLCTRLRQLGVHSLHGVPGDYNLTALDHVHPCKLTWVGNCNELNAGYAADGYSRIKGLGAVITAFGVGELSAINAIGGAYAEQSAVVHIVGTPPRSAQRAGTCLHHSLGDGNFRVFARMAKMVTVAQAELIDEAAAAGEVDRVLRECLLQSRPVYLELPTDMVSVPVDARRLETPIDTSPALNSLESEKAEQKALGCILGRISQAKQPFLIIDGFSARYSIFPELDRLVRILNWPTTSTPFGKSCIDETLPNFHGIYAGIAGKSVYKPWVDSCDLVLRFGGLDSDVNTYGFSTLPPEAATINIQRDYVLFGGEANGQKMEGVHIKSLLGKLVHSLTALDAQGRIPRMEPYPSHLGDPRAELASLPFARRDAVIEQHDFWQRISHFFVEGDVILTETGTPSVGSREFVLPRHARLINSSIWLSIGFMLAAAQGAALALREIGLEGAKRGKPSSGTEDGVEASSSHPSSGPQQQQQQQRQQSVRTASTTYSKRTILFEGDGSFQMSVQEVSTIIKHKLDLTLFLINNDGYTIERFIHGMRAHYNDVAAWRYCDAPRFFGAEQDEVGSGNGNGNGSEARNGAAGNKGEKTPPPPYRVQTHQARTWGELLDVLGRDEVISGKGFCMIEVFMGREDAPESLKRLVRNVARRNSGEGESVDGERGEGGNLVDGEVEGENGVVVDLDGGSVGEEEEEEEGGEVVEEKVMKAAG